MNIILRFAMNILAFIYVSVMTLFRAIGYKPKYKKFIIMSGNKMKIREISYILKSLDSNVVIQAFNIDLAEIQSTDVEEVMSHKIKEAKSKISMWWRYNTYIICDDTGLHFKNSNGFPGALIKFYMKHLTLGGVVQAHENKGTKAVTCIGVLDSDGNCNTFTGELCGTVIPMSKLDSSKMSNTSSNWDPLFIPNYPEEFAEYNGKTLADIPQDIKNKVSPRYLALRSMFEHYFSINS